MAGDVPSSPRSRALKAILRLFGGLALAVCSAPGCGDVGQSVDCHRACEKLDACSSELDVDYCHVRCADDREEQRELYNALQRCTDCLDETYTCAEIADKCPICTNVSSELISAQPSAGGTGGSGGEGGGGDAAQ
jgi:hypothetical protein